MEGYPTFNYYNYGKYVEKYTGERGVRNLNDVCDEVMLATSGKIAYIHKYIVIAVSSELT